MDTLVRKELALPFSENDLRTLVSASDAPKRRVHDVPIVAYKDIPRIRSIPELLGAEGTCIIWYQTGDNMGHWTSLVRIGPKKLEFFCPYGMSIDKQLAMIPVDYRMRTGQQAPHLTNLINSQGWAVVSSGMKLQKMKSGVSSCGRFVGIRIAMYQQGIRNLSDFQHLFVNQKLTPDEYAALLSMAIR
jgi:hypothetical protein